MGRRTEHRIAACLPVVVYGVDDQGNPFTQTATTVNVSASGALLQGLECVDRPGAMIAIEYEDRKALFRVQWVGEAGSSRAGQVGVQCLDVGKYIWGIKLAASDPDEFDHEAPKTIAPPEFFAPPRTSTVPWAGNERRQFSRVACRLESKVRTADSTTELDAKVIDICLGGCYLEMMTPLPVGSSIEVVIELEDSTISARGKVCATHPGIGMGISFTGMHPDDLKKLRAIVPLGPGTPQVPPAMSIIPEVKPELTPVPAAAAVESTAGARAKAQPSAAEGLEAVVRVLFRKGILDRSELFDEIERLKARRN